MGTGLRSAGHVSFLIIFILWFTSARSIPSLNFNWDDGVVYSSYTNKTDSTINFVRPPELKISSESNLTSFYVVNGGNQVVFFNLSSNQTTTNLFNNSIYSLLQVPITHDLELSTWNYDPLGKAFLYLTSSQLLLCTNFSSDSTCSNFTLTSNANGSLTYSPSDTLVYVSRFEDNQILAFNISDPVTFLSSPIQMYGGGSSSSLSDTSLQGPRQTAADCEGGLWVVDSINNRVLHYPRGSNIADIVLGQPNFTTSGAGTNDNQFSVVTSIALDQKCSVLFVGDFTRVLRFRLPLDSFTSAEAVLGFTRFTENNVPSTFNFISWLQFEDYNDGTGRLYVVDQENNLVTSGITDISPSSGEYSLPCQKTSSEQTCNINGDLYVINQQILILNTSELRVEGDLYLGSNTSVMLETNQTIMVNGTVTFNGNLIISGAETSSSLLVFRYNASLGEFSSVEAIGGNDNCALRATPSYGLSSMTLYISHQCSGQYGGIQMRLLGVIGVGIIVGGCVLFVLLYVIVAEVVVIRYRRRGKKKATISV
eukprot:TRINITY_DN22070_c0_g1_i1.p1 TRINITY_DN22070_c0_g1~~TRINITY_DN22070_c0_g1_i1.p1  ORF type:complete len:538 (-),score=55.97 TRINITY_DN22070_c0_g1_i1:79-1692(-)